MLHHKLEGNSVKVIYRLYEEISSINKLELDPQTLSLIIKVINNLELTNLRIMIKKFNEKTDDLGHQLYSFVKEVKKGANHLEKEEINKYLYKVDLSFKAKLIEHTMLETLSVCNRELILKLTSGTIERDLFLQLSKIVDFLERNFRLNGKSLNDKVLKKKAYSLILFHANKLAKFLNIELLENGSNKQNAIIKKDAPYSLILIFVTEAINRLLNQVSILINLEDLEHITPKINNNICNKLETNHIDFLDQVFIINPKTAFMSECDRELIKNDLIHIEMLCGKSFISSQKIISSIIDKINSHAAISAKKLRAECNTYDLKKLKHDIDNLTNVLGEKI